MKSERPKIRSNFMRIDNSDMYAEFVMAVLTNIANYTFSSAWLCVCHVNLHVMKPVLKLQVKTFKLCCDIHFIQIGR